MEITTVYFGLASLASVFIYYLLGNRFRMLFIALLSSLFIATYSYTLVIYIAAWALLNFWLGIAINRSGYSRIIFRTGILLNLLQLFILRYASFTFDPLFDFLEAGFRFSWISELIVPVGISFFTLQGIGYLINVRMKWEKPEENFIHFFVYIAYYPKFLSGPIERSNNFLPRLKSPVVFDQGAVSDGLRTALFGVFKKVAVANQLAPIVSNAWANIGSADGSPLLVLFFIQPLYLYFDFSGYTDIAIGISRAFGINLLPNFNKPFLSENMTGFWKRFHISLSSWFNDYVFRQASFRLRRWGVSASVTAVIITWLLFGIWHGAGWNFMLLGLLQAAVIIYEFFTKKWRTGIFSYFPGYAGKWIGRIFTYLFFAVCMVFFFSPDIESTGSFFSKLFNGSDFVLHGIRPELFVIVLLIITLTLLGEILENDFPGIRAGFTLRFAGNKLLTRIARWIFYCILISIIIVFSNDVQQFIYFRF